MKTLAIAAFLALTLAASAQTPTLNLSPMFAIESRGLTVLYTASFSDGSTVQSCQWSESGTGSNGDAVTQSPLGPQYGAFSTGNLGPLTYQVKTTCANSNGITAQASATVAVN